MVEAIELKLFVWVLTRIIVRKCWIKAFGP